MINLTDNSDIIKCIGTNENNVSATQFHQQFQAECMKLGFILMFRANNRFAGALVIPVKEN